MHDLIIVGAGAFAREIRQLVATSIVDGPVRLKGFVSNNPHNLEEFDVPEPILDDPERYVPQPNDRFVMAIGDQGDRKRVAEALTSRGAKFLRLIHPTAYIDASARIGEGCVIYPFSTVMNAAHIGDFVMMSIYSSAGHDTQIGEYCNLSPYATLNGFSVLEDDVFLGTHASVAAMRRVGRGSKISANSVAAHDVPPYTLVYGVPGKQVPLVRADNRSGEAHPMS